MFTGIITEIGEVVAVTPTGDGARITVRAPGAVADATHGESIAVSGVCLTLIGATDETFDADVMKQTLDVSALGGIRPGTNVNIEKALRASDRLGGHIVQGHVDGVGEVVEVRPGAEWTVLRISLPAELAPLVVDKGSITVSGTSLTVSAVSEPGGARGKTSSSRSIPAESSATVDISRESDPQHWFEVSLIPETLRATTLGALKPGDVVNLETDIIARHAARLLAFQNGENA